VVVVVAKRPGPEMAEVAVQDITAWGAV